MNSDKFRENILELIRRTSAFLPADVEEVMKTMFINLVGCLAAQCHMRSMLVVPKNH